MDVAGDWQVLRTDIVMELGKSLNPAIDVGQIEGSFYAGLRPLLPGAAQGLIKACQ